MNSRVYGTFVGIGVSALVAAILLITSFEGAAQTWANVASVTKSRRDDT